MAVTRSPADIEKDIANIDHALTTVSEIRSSLRQFTELVQTEQKGSNFVHSFSDRLKIIRLDLNTLSAEGENLKGVLEHTQVAAAENNFNWELIKNEAEKQAAEEEIRYREEEANSGKEKEAGALVKASADFAYNELASVVLERKPNLTPSEPLFFTKHISEWIANNKPASKEFSVQFREEEQPTLAGSTCHIRICTRKALAAEIEFEYERATDSLIIHQYDIKNVKEEKLCWQDSQFLVFQKVNLLATTALEDMLVFFAKESLYAILNWIASYHDMFTRPCHRCHKILQFDSPQYKYLPPMVRTWTKKQSFQKNPSLRMETGVAYHLRCFAEYKNSHAM